MRKSLFVLLAAMIAMVTVLSACGAKTQDPQTGGNSPQAAVKPVSMKVGMLKLTSSAPLFIAMEKGFFTEEGIEVSPEWFEAAQPIAVATASGSVDVGATGITASLYNMIAGGQKLLIVADKGREQKGYSSSALMVPSDSTIASVKDLKGKKLGITQTGSTFHYMAGRLLENYGLTLADIELVPLGKVSAMMETLKSKQVDAVLLNEPNITAVVKEGYGKVIAQVGDEIEYQTSGMFFSQKFADNRDAAIRFLKAYIKATRYYYDAVLVQNDGKPAPGANYDEVISIIAKYTDQPAENIKLGLPYMDRDGKLLAEDIKTQIDWYFNNKMIEKAVDYKTVVNTELLEEALKSAGK
jgi:NitT/TauT family transport system substrate-binding protein